MKALRGESTRKHHNTRISRGYKKNIAQGDGGGGGVVEHIKIEKILHIPENQCT